MHTFIKHCKKVQNEKCLTLVNYRSDHGGEFENYVFEMFCNENGFGHNFSTPRTFQQNWVVERKNCTFKKNARTILCENNLSKYFLGEAIKRPLRTKTPYELYKGRKPNVSHLRSFGCKCFVLNDEKHPIGKMDAKSDKAIFMSYALHFKAYKVFNKSSLIVEESMHVIFYKTNVTPKK